MNFEQLISEGTTEIFETMIGVPISPGKPFRERITIFENSFSGIMGLSGSLQGMLCLHCPFPVAARITSMLLGTEGDAEEIRDAVGELANMVAGSLKIGLAQGGKAVQLSLPTAVSGREYSVSPVDSGGVAAVQFETPEGRLLVEFRYKWIE